MLRNLARLSRDSFDVIVIGGGIYGLASTWDLASRGLRVALLEREDFAGATSFNSLKTIHGGIRALQHGDIPEMRTFVRERRTFARIAPHLVRPLAFVVPTARHPVRNRWTMALFFAAYDQLARDRNVNISPSCHLPRSRTVERTECLRLNPVVARDGVTGGAIWYDYQLAATERFALALLHSSDAAGAALANYTEAESILTQAGQVAGVRVIDRSSDSHLDVRAPIVINAAGAEAWPILARDGLAPARLRAPRFSLAMNVVVDHRPLPHAVGGIVSNRFLFMVPWRDRSIVGTSHDQIAPGVSDAEGARAALVAALLRDATRAFPHAGLTRDAITLVHRGMLPAGDGKESLLKRSIVHDHRADGLPGLLTIVGVRYTTARATAEQAGDLVCQLLGRQIPSRTERLPLAGGDIEDVARYTGDQIASTGLPATLVERLVGAYGTQWRAVTTLMEADPSLATPLSSTCRVTRAEILYAARHEMAMHVTDALLRRTEAGAGGHPGSEAVDAAVRVMAAEQGWNAQRRAAEIALLNDTYAVAWSHGSTHAEQGSSS